MRLYKEGGLVGWVVIETIRGDVLNDKRFPLSHLSLFDEARKSLYYLKNTKNINSIQMVPVYLSIEENMINESEIAMFRTILSPRKLIISFQFRCRSDVPFIDRPSSVRQTQTHSQAPR